MVAEEDDDGVGLLARGAESGQAFADGAIGEFDGGEILGPVLTHDRRVGEKRGEFHVGGVDADFDFVAVGKRAVRLADVKKQVPRFLLRSRALDKFADDGAALFADEFIVGKFFIGGDVELARVPVARRFDPMA